jgi:hypothetical protein
VVVTRSTPHPSDAQPVLAPYLRRYVEARYGWWALDEQRWWGLDGQQSWLDYALDGRRAQGIANLRSTAARVAYGGLTVDELFDALDRLDERTTTSASTLVGEVVDRLECFSPADLERLVDVLCELHVREMPPMGCLTVDRALQRLLFQFCAPNSHDLAGRCLRSRRTIRRRAAYKFYRHHGLDQVARRVLARQFADNALEAPDLVAVDSALVGELGPARVLEAAPTTYFRKRAIEAAMESMPPDKIAAICEDYPQELVWAVHDQRRAEYLPLVVGMLDDYRHDAYLLDRVVGCIARIGGRQEVEHALDVASMLLDDTLRGG